MWLDGNTIWYYLFKSANYAVGYLKHYLKLTICFLEDLDKEIVSSAPDCIWSAKLRATMNRRKLDMMFEEVLKNNTFKLLS